MTMCLKDWRRLSLKTRRRMVVTAVGVALLAGVALGAATAPGGSGAATRPATSQSSKDAAKAEYQKAKAFYDQQKYADAKAENDKALDLDPANVDAVLMNRVLEGKVTAGGAGAATTTGPAGKLGVLTAAQISMVRLMELGPADGTVRGKVDRSVLDDFWNDFVTKDPMADKSKPAHDAFMRPDNFSVQAARIKASADPKYMEKLTINTDPAVIVAFRSGVYTYVNSNCVECHVGDKGGDFRLVNSGGTATELLYTDFYILSMYANADGKMLDRDNPEKSLLLQYSLPWAAAGAKHPVKDIHKLANRTDARFRSTVEWIKTLALPKPNYGITYEMPSATNPPATAP